MLHQIPDQNKRHTSALSVVKIIVDTKISDPFQGSHKIGGHRVPSSGDAAKIELHWLQGDSNIKYFDYAKAG